MISYQFITDLFKSVLGQSKAIQGRFYVCPKMGTEINSDNLGQVLQDLKGALPDKKYPLCLMMPPRSTFRYPGGGKDAWENYRITLFFLKTTYFDSNNQTSLPNLSTGTSTHTIEQDWHDMKRVANNFIVGIDKVIRSTVGLGNKFRMQSADKTVSVVSTIGIDRASGVRLDFNCELYQDCIMEDYPDDFLTHINVPVGDSHPEHNL